MTSACGKDVTPSWRGRGRGHLHVKNMSKNSIEGEGAGSRDKCPLFHKLKSGHPTYSLCDACLNMLCNLCRSTRGRDKQIVSAVSQHCFFQLSEELILPHTHTYLAPLPNTVSL